METTHRIFAFIVSGKVVIKRDVISEWGKHDEESITIRYALSEEAMIRSLIHQVLYFLFSDKSEYFILNEEDRVFESLNMDQYTQLTNFLASIS